MILANHAIKLLTSLFQDLQVEALHKVRWLFFGVCRSVWGSLNILAGAISEGSFLTV